MIFLNLGNSMTGEIRKLGPFDFVQIIYNYLVRVDENETLMSTNLAGVWVLLEDNTEWTDLTIVGE